VIALTRESGTPFLWVLTSESAHGDRLLLKGLAAMRKDILTVGQTGAVRGNLMDRAAVSLVSVSSSPTRQ